MPRSDVAGAQVAYDTIVRQACERVIVTGPERYRARCDTVLRDPAPPVAEPFPCDDQDQDPVAVKACND